MKCNECFPSDVFKRTLFTETETFGETYVQNMRPDETRNIH